jgi:hypothetical protein
VRRSGRGVVVDPRRADGAAWSGKANGLEILGAVVMWVAFAAGGFFFVAPLRRWFGRVERTRVGRGRPA